MVILVAQEATRGGVRMRSVSEVNDKAANHAQSWLV